MMDEELSGMVSLFKHIIVESANINHLHITTQEEPLDESSVM